MKNSNKSWIVFVIAFAACLYGLYSINSNDKQKTETVGSEFDTSSVNENSFEVKPLQSVVKDTNKINNDNDALPLKENEVPRNPNRSPRVSSPGENKDVPNSGLGRDTEDKAIAQQMAVRQKVSDKIVQTNMERTQFELERGSAVLKRIRANHGNLR